MSFQVHREAYLIHSYTKDIDITLGVILSLSGVTMGGGDHAPPHLTFDCAPFIVMPSSFPPKKILTYATVWGENLILFLFKRVSVL